jgi:hypothetical protein
VCERERERERESARGELETGFDREVGRFVFQLLHISKFFLSFRFSRFELRHFDCVVFVGFFFFFGEREREREREGRGCLFGACYDWKVHITVSSSADRKRGGAAVASAGGEERKARTTAGTEGARVKPPTLSVLDIALWVGKLEKV